MEPLSKLERGFYWFAGVCAFAYAQWEFYRLCQEKKPYMRFQEGWQFLGGKRDALDYEWACVRSCLIKLITLIAGHLLVSQVIIRIKLNENVLKLCVLLYDSLAFLYLLGVKATLIFLIESLLMLAMCQQNFISVVWIIGLILTSSLNFEWFDEWLVFKDWSRLKDKQLFYISNAYLHIRLISAGIEMIRERKQISDKLSHNESENFNQNYSSELSTPQQSFEKTKDNKTHLNGNHCEKPSALDFMCYSMYFPNSMYGPIVTFDEFHPQRKSFFKSFGRTCSLSTIFLLALRILFWLLVLECAAHFMYPNSVSLDLQIVSKLSCPGMIGFVMWQSLYFTMKYVIVFAIGSLACKIDGVNAPPGPRCTATMYRYTDIWKYFDVGYYNFTKKYIYVPLGGSQCGFIWQCFSSVMAFAFIFYWHGGTLEIFLWAAGNWSVIAVEMIAVQLLKTKAGSSLKSLLSPAAMKRVKAILYVPCFVVSSIQIACFFFSKEIAYRMADVMILSASWSAILLQILYFYFNFVNAMYITEHYAHAAVKGKQD